MNKKFSSLNLEDLRDKIDIVALIEEYGIPLERSGDNYVALCPFHSDDRTKSFFVCPATNTWWCFGCKKGSSVFDFIMEIEHKTFWEAVQFLAEKVGYTDTFSIESLQKRLNKLENKEEIVDLLKFKQSRGILEDRVYEKMREKLEKSTFLDENIKISIKELWRWYDESQSWFNLYIYYYKSGENIDIEFLIKKLHSFYSKFLEKLEKIA